MLLLLTLNQIKTVNTWKITLKKYHAHLLTMLSKIQTNIVLQSLFVIILCNPFLLTGTQTLVVPLATHDDLIPIAVSTQEDSRLSRYNQALKNVLLEDFNKNSFCTLSSQHTPQFYISLHIEADKIYARLLSHPARIVYESKKYS